MPYHWNYPRVPDVAKLGSNAHRRTVKNLYRRTLKWYKMHCRFRYDHWDWNAMHVRKHFEESRKMTDPGGVNRIMKELEQALDIYEDPDMPCSPWDGPKGTDFHRYPESPKGRFIHAEGITNYDQDWTDETTEEHYAKQEIEKYRARYITIFRDSTLAVSDYPQWLAIKKRLEEELKYRIEDIQTCVGKTYHGWIWDWPYNTVNEFSDGWKPDWNLDIAFQDHWDEELWRKVAELEEPEEEALRQHTWTDAASPRTIDRYLPK